MTALRRFLRRYENLALLLVFAAVLMRVVVPTGFMPVAATDGTIVVRICSDTGLGPTEMVLAIPGLPAGDGDGSGHGKAPKSCVFAGLAAPLLGSSDAVSVMLALGFFMALAIGFAPGRTIGTFAHLRPPLRGPPQAF